MTEHSYSIAGAGPAGLAAAITLANAGRNVIVHEANPKVGVRFQRDLQGLENWSSNVDILDEFSAFGLSLAFKRLPAVSGTAFDAWGKSHPTSCCLLPEDGFEVSETMLAAAMRIVIASGAIVARQTTESKNDGH